MHLFTEEELWIMNSCFSHKMLDLFHLLSSPDVNGVLWIIVMFLSALVLTAPIHLHC